MFLYKFSYHEYRNTPREWQLKEFELNDINLIVGTNASGKSRTLNVISGLTKLLLNPKIQYNSGRYNACFKSDTDSMQYTVEYDNGVIVLEEFRLNEETLFSRNEKGEGKILNSDLSRR